MSMNLILISGMGGSGRTTAIHTLEDLGYYCVDNLPVILLTEFLDHLKSHSEIRRVAVGIDVRDRLFWDQVPSALARLGVEGIVPKVLFLDADDEVLIRRYKETRRVHPLDRAGDIAEAIRKERRMLGLLEPYINTCLDTSGMTPHELRAWITAHYGHIGSRMRVSLVSFGYKHGILSDADLVFDVRFLKNPYFVPDLAHKTGLDREVRDYVFSDPDAGVFLEKTANLIRFLIPRYAHEGRNYLTIGVGCTGGQHRSASLAIALYEELRSCDDYEWICSHRDIRQ